MAGKLFFGIKGGASTVTASLVGSALVTLMLVTAFGGQIAFGHHVVEEIDVAKRPLRMSIANDMLYVANIGEPSVSVVDTKTDKTVGTINTTGGVSALYALPDSGKLYVSIFEAGRVEVYNLKTFDFVKNITLPGTAVDYWYSPLDNYDKHVTVLTGGVSMDYNPSTAMMYVAVYNHDHIEVIDTKTDTAVKTIDVPAHPFTVKVDPAAKEVLVASLASNKLTFISTDTNEKIGDVTVGYSPWGLDIDNVTHTAYVTHMSSPYVAVVDIATRAVTAKIPLTDDAQAIAVDSGEHKVYFSYMDQENVVKIDGKTNQVETVIQLDAIPWDLVVDHATHKVYASIKYSDRVVAIGPQSMSTTLPVLTADTPTAVLGTIRAHGQDVAVSDAFLDIAGKKLSMSVSTGDGGDLTLQLPQSIIDARQAAGNGQFQVMIDGKQAQYDEGQPVTADDGTQSREISVFVPKSASKLEITGTQVVPEFGSAAGLLVAAIAVVSLVVYSRLSAPARAGRTGL